MYIPNPPAGEITHGIV